jgi:hypothetical protein
MSILKHLIQIDEYRVHLSYQFPNGIQVRKAADVPSSEQDWKPLTQLNLFTSNFPERNPLNIPGPFYGADTDTCETGTAEAPHNVLLDRSSQEFVFTQPRCEDELRDIISAADCECFVGYGADGNDHWTLALIREWWQSRAYLLDLSSHVMGLPESKRRWERILSGEGEAYLRLYAFFIENRRLPSEKDRLPEIG